MVRVLLLGRLRDVAGVSEIEVSRRFDTLAALRAHLAANNSALSLALSEPSVRVAIDQAIAGDDACIASAREIAFMPPLSGG